MNASVAARDALVASLQHEVEKLEGGRPVEDERPVSTGVTALDRLLPAGGLKRGTLVEYLSGSGGSAAGGGGAATLSLAAAREACGEGRALVVVEMGGERGAERWPRNGSAGASPSQRNGSPSQIRASPSQNYFYPPAAAAWGIDLSAMLVLRTTNEADAVWAFDQALRCPGVGAVWGAWKRLDVRDFRRLQLAAEIGGTVGLLIRSAKLRGQSTWAEVRWEVGSLPLLMGEGRGEGFKETGLFGRFGQTYHPHPRPTAAPRVPRLPEGEGTAFSQHRHCWQWQEKRGWRVQVELVRCRGAAGGRKVVLELDETTGVWREADYEPAHCVSVFAELADSTGARRA